MMSPYKILKSLGTLGCLYIVGITPPIWAQRSDIPPAFTLSQPPEASGVKRMVLRSGASDEVLLSFKTMPTQPFLRFAKTARKMNELRGSFTLGKVEYPCAGELPVMSQTLNLSEAGPVTLTGKITGPGCGGHYTLTLSVLPATAQRAEKLSLTVTAPETYPQTELSLESSSGPYYGLGMQFDPAALAGTYPMVVQEGGIGQRITALELANEHGITGIFRPERQQLLSATDPLESAGKRSATHRNIPRTIYCSQNACRTPAYRDGSSQPHLTGI